MFLDDVVDEGDATSFSSERTLTDSCKIGILVETVFMEHRHHSLVFHLSVSDDGIKNDLSVSIHILE